MDNNNDTMKGTHILILILIIGGLAIFFMQDKEMEDTMVGEEATTTDEVIMENEAATEMTEEVEDEDIASTTDAAEGVVFDITGKNFEFSLSEITVKEGDTVTINFQSESGLHDWVVDDFEAATEQVSDGGTTTVTFIAAAAGEYEYYCSVGNHRAEGMVGTLIVE